MLPCQYQISLTEILLGYKLQPTVLKQIYYNKITMEVIFIISVFIFTLLQQ